VTKAKIKRMIEAAIEAARKQGVPYVEVTEDGTTLRIPLVPDDQPVAAAAPVSDNDDWSGV
jgi:hypothetical protein